MGCHFQDCLQKTLTFILLDLSVPLSISVSLFLSPYLSLFLSLSSHLSLSLSQSLSIFLRALHYFFTCWPPVLMWASPWRASHNEEMRLPSNQNLARNWGPSYQQPAGNWVLPTAMWVSLETDPLPLRPGHDFSPWHFDQLVRNPELKSKLYPGFWSPGTIYNIKAQQPEHWNNQNQNHQWLWHALWQPTSLIWAPIAPLPPGWPGPS